MGSDIRSLPETRCLPVVPTISPTAAECVAALAAHRKRNSGITPARALRTMNSVEPPTAPNRAGTIAIFPFSRQGVMRAKSVSPPRALMPPREPLLVEERAQVPHSSTSAIVMKGASEGSCGSVGFTDATSPSVVSIQSSFIVGSEVGDACGAESFEECSL